MRRRCSIISLLGGDNISKAKDIQSFGGIKLLQWWDNVLTAAQQGETTFEKVNFQITKKKETPPLVLMKELVLEGTCPQICILFSLFPAQ